MGVSQVSLEKFKRGGVFKNTQKYLKIRLLRVKYEVRSEGVKDPI